VTIFCERSAQTIDSICDPLRRRTVTLFVAVASK
jgi:hypothetical protein